MRARRLLHRALGGRVRRARRRRDVAGIYQTGASARTTCATSGGILAASAVGLLAHHARAPASRATYYALRDTRTPLRFASCGWRSVSAIAISAAASCCRDALGLDARWGAAGLALASGIAGWVELRCCGARSSAASGARAWPVRCSRGCGAPRSRCAAVALGVKRSAR